MLYGIPQLNCRARVSTQVGSLSYGPWPSLQLPSSASVHIVVLMIIAHRLNCLLHSNDQAQTSNVYFTECNASLLHSETAGNKEQGVELSCHIISVPQHFVHCSSAKLTSLKPAYPRSNIEFELEACSQ